jgi:hypothetical protein
VIPIALALLSLSLLLGSLYRFVLTPGFVGFKNVRNREKPGLQCQWKLIHDLRMPAETACVSRVTKFIPGNLGLLLVSELAAAKPLLKKA